MSLRKLARRLKGGPGSGHHGHGGRPGKRGGSSPGRGIPLNSPQMKQQISKAAQKVIDEWEQDEEGFDPEFGGGGACDRVCSVTQDVILDKSPDFDVYDGGQAGDDHAWTIAHNPKTGQSFGVDIHPNVYEIGGGYSWRKIEGAKITPNDVDIWTIDNFEPY